ncbi:MAG: holo-ACP synthase [Eubacteriales bacterium]|nr:holo-ACP synthase [Eubacteriales bacterium]
MTGLGTDMIEIERIKKALERPAFWHRVFTEAEQEWLKQRGEQMPQSAAGLFCAKEAVAKALGTGFRHGFGLCDIEIGHTELGAPYVILPHQRFLLSISHCQTYATATAILLAHAPDGGNHDTDN